MNTESKFNSNNQSDIRLEDIIYPVSRTLLYPYFMSSNVFENPQTIIDFLHLPRKIEKKDK